MSGSTVSVIGAGPIGGAIAFALARRAGVRDIVLIDESTAAAAGKALDIQQSGPIMGFTTRLSATADPLAAAGSTVIILADRIEGGEWQGDAGVELIRTLVRAGAEAPIVLAGAAQTALMETAVRQLGVARDRILGTAAAAMIGAARALVGIELGGSGAGVQLTVAGRPPRFVIGWSAATAGGSLVNERVPAHRLVAMSQTLAQLWPPGPHSIAASTARVTEGLIAGTRQSVQALVILDGEFGARGSAGLLPVDLAHGRIVRRLVPTLSQQERQSVG